MLYTKENACLNSCLQCGEGRYEENINSNTRGKKQSRKVLRYFHLIPRLQRLFMSSKTVKWMIWRHNNKSRDGLMRHPTDSDEWAAFDNKHALFAEETRNVRLGLASDGFNPFKNMHPSYSIWPVVIFIYNLLPWMYMRSSFMMLTLLIPGKRALGCN